MMEHSETAGAPWMDFAVAVALQGPGGPFELDVALRVAKGDFIVLAGPSGAGKTSLLRLLAGLMRPGSGRVRVGPTLWCDTPSGIFLPVRHRPLGFVFQDYALFPNMTVEGNVAYALGRRRDRAEVRRLLELVGLEGLAGAYPARLSGGQKQRLALIRALARRPEVLMLDEPLSALDPAMRRQLQGELKRLHWEFGTTTFMVSHDLVEILNLADRVVRLENGRVVADGAPAGALGLEEGALRLAAQHVSGPDADGFAVVQVDGRLRRIRYRGAPQDLAAGDLVTLDLAEALVSKEARS